MTLIIFFPYCLTFGVFLHTYCNDLVLGLGAKTFIHLPILALCHPVSFCGVCRVTLSDCLFMWMTMKMFGSVPITCHYHDY